MIGWSMDRFILRFTGKGEPPADDIRRIRELSHAQVIDTSPRMLLVEAPSTSLNALVRSMPAWTVSAERFVPLPDSRPKVR
jgi:hypothetical protein